MESGRVVEKFGSFHVLHFFLTCLPALFNAMSNVNFVLLTSDVNYRCRVPECESNRQEYMPTWWPTAVDRCSRPVLNGTIKTTCTNTSFSDALEKCDEWIYETNNTVIAELGLACQPIKANMIGTMHNIAMATSMLLAGRIADWIGRKPTMIFCSVSTFLGIFKTLAPSYYVYIAFEFLEAIGAGGIVTVGLVIMIETSNKKYRLLGGVLFGYFIYTGEVIFACLAMVIPYWKNLLYAVYAPTILFLLYIPISKETLRWLIIHEKVDEAKRLIKTIVKMNKVDIDPNDIDKMDLETMKVACEVETIETKEGYTDAFKSPELVKRFLIGTFCRFTVVFIYYGLTVNSVGLPGNRNMNFLLTSLISYPGDFLCLIFMNRFGRKFPLICGYALCGVTCVLFAFVPSGLNWLKITLYLISKLVVAACYTGVVTYIIELFPTSVRGSLFGLCILFASLGTTLAPLTPSLSTIMMSICFGCSAITSSILLFFVPETNNRQLVDTVEQLEDMMRANKERSVKYRNGHENCGFDHDEESRAH
ncbi:organic cation transporter protein-like [Zerene cesonia]|uniref:organic cation transporter protein-like n=1 Tax=Zerene cesonia TaxID=33412 RepID=UPI0018E566C4|nr:organic cation transporter protein-like [Zerene cesonia]